ncbi:MAG TPA: sulfotransferase [Ktedonobacterales bacterium]|jgi:hypothetical protein
MPVAVIGMHRSGTSMVSRLLNLCGVYLGDERDMVPAHESNLAGHWEHARIVELNNQVLEALGGAWHEPPLAPSRWERLPEIEPLRERAAELVAAHFVMAGAGADNAGWGWKDPRTSLTVPFWRAVVPETRYIICVRNPLDVAASLAARDQMSRRKALALWHWYTDAALRATQGGERLVVFYERFFPDVRQALGPVLAFLGLPAISAGSEREEALRQFADPELMHHSHTLDTVLASDEVPSETRDLYRDLLRQAGPDGTLATFALPPDPATCLHLTVAVEAQRERAEHEHRLMTYIRKLEAAMKSYREAQERTEGEREEALAHLRDVEHALGLVRAAQERTLAEKLDATTYARQLESALEHARQNGARIDAERAEAVEYTRQLEQARDLLEADRARIDAERAEAVAYARQLEAARDLLEADRARIDGERAEAVTYARDLERALAERNGRHDRQGSQGGQGHPDAQINAEA